MPARRGRALTALAAAGVPMLEVLIAGDRRRARARADWAPHPPPAADQAARLHRPRAAPVRRRARDPGTRARARRDRRARRRARLGRGRDRHRHRRPRRGRHARSSSSRPTSPSGRSRSSTTAASSAVRGRSSPRSTRSWSGITGSFGKTTTKVCVAAVAELRGPAYATPASYNTFLGVVRAINEGLTARHRTLIAEMGAYRLGDVAELCDLVHPRIGDPHRDRAGAPRAVRLARRHRAGEGRAGGGPARRRHLHHDGRRRALPAHDRADAGAACCCSARPARRMRT